jgi:hypothetical protein
MKGNKIIATLVVLTMVLSTLVVLNKLNIDVVREAGAVTPGVNAWGNATTNLEYGVTYANVYVNSSRWGGAGPFFLYYPTYRSGGTEGNANEFTWDGPYLVGGYSVRVTNISNSQIIYTGGSSISFNRSGMWIFDNDASHQGDDNTTYAGYIWVNTSTKYSIESVSNFDYGSTGSLTITVNTGNDTGCMIDIMGPDNKTVYHKWRAIGVTEPIKIEAANFSKAGDYTIKAYRDFDSQNSTYYYPDENNRNYSMFYGSDYSGTFPPHPGITSEFYSYANMGPWDPPEKNATEITFTVNTGVPKIAVTNTSIYWGFKTRIDINVTDPDGNGIDITNARSVISLKKGATYYHGAYINNTRVTEGQQPGNYSIEIPRWLSGQAKGWTNLTDWVNSGHTIKNNNTNGTWRVVFGYDVPPADDTYEWNTSASFSVKSANPPVQLVIVDDGYAKKDDKKVEVPAYVSGANVASTIDIQFDILGRSISNEYRNAYYGDNADELAGAMDNITIEGDILYPITDTTLTYNADPLNPGRWTATVTPTKPGGTITLKIDWPGDYNGSAIETIEIVNGTYVTSAVDSFTIGADYNLTITIKDMDGTAVKNAHIILLWQDIPSRCNETNGTNKAGNGLNGEYTFWIPPHSKKDSTPDKGPQNLTIAAQWYSHFWGYAKVIMDRDHNMQVNITPTTSYAGDATEYDIMVSLLGGGHPDKTSGSGLTVMIYNATGHAVTNPDIVSGTWPITEKYEITNHEIILTGGTYYLYAYNDTSDSRGNNATLIISNYTVTSSPSVLAWKIDTEVNMTFQLTPAGNGTLTIYNMTSLPNASALGQSTQVPIENGVGTLDGVNATTLGNVTFWFTPDNGESRPADGLLRVTTATATPSPKTIYTGESTLVTITITHPATGMVLKDVLVSLDNDKNATASILAKKPTEMKTDAAGKVEFSLTAQASGNITIFIENETDPDNEFVIVAAARKPMTISNDPSVDEGKTFTVQAKSNGVLITDATVSFTFNGQTTTTTTGTATLTAPSVITSLNYPIDATADGYTSASNAIMVINVPKLTIIPPSGKVYGKEQFTVTIANDAGAGVSGAKVAFNGVDYYSGANGVCELTAPDVPEKNGRDMTITATFAGYTDATPIVKHIEQTKGVPGFELLTLIAAIGVAFLLLRRRRK